jgi:hypothetical protein
LSPHLHADISVRCWRNTVRLSHLKHWASSAQISPAGLHSSTGGSGGRLCRTRTYVSILNNTNEANSKYQTHGRREQPQIRRDEGLLTSTCCSAGSGATAVTSELAVDGESTEISAVWSSVSKDCCPLSVSGASLIRCVCMVQFSIIIVV